jgi:hypothetical protein
MAEISVQTLNWRQWSTFAPTWERIHSLCPDASFFLSREWVDCWLATFGADLNPDLMTFVKDGDVVGCCLLVWRTQWVRGIPLRRVYLNCSGENESDSTCIEYNSLLSLPDCGEPVAKALGTFLRTRYWDELLLNGVVERSPISAMASALGSNEFSEMPAHYVDFDRIRRPGEEYINLLSPKVRAHIRRSLRTYEQIGGNCELDVARNAEEALAILRQLAELHQTSWTDRGRAGVFGSPTFLRFHERLVRSEFDHGTILLMRLQAGQQIVGALYSFVHRGCVYFYQSGFHYTLDSRMSPGLATLCMAVSYCLERPELNGFDFLAGDSQYKRALATDSRPLRWIVVRRSTVPSLLFRGLRWVKRRYVEILEKSRRKNQPTSGREPHEDVSVPNIEAGRMVGDRGKLQHDPVGTVVARASRPAIGDRAVRCE